MSALATQAETHPAGSTAADPHGYREVLHDLIAIGADFARLLHGHAAQAAQQTATPAPPGAPAPPAPQPASPGPQAQPAPAPASAALIGLAAAFDGVARAVRRCVMLAQSLDKPAPPLPDPARQRAAARKRIIRAVEDTIQRPHHGSERDPDGPAADALRAELHERLDAPDLDDDIATRPVADIIEEIRRDLGLDRMPGTRPFGRRTPADVALLHARAAAPSRPRPPGPGPGPQHPEPAARCAPAPLDGHGSDQPAATRAQPALVHPGRSLPDDPAEAVAFVLRHGVPAAARWRPPPPS